MRFVCLLALIAFAGCHSQVYRGDDLQKVVDPRVTSFTNQQMALIKAGQVEFALQQLSDTARDPAKFNEHRDKARRMLEAANVLGGSIVSYKIIEAVRTTVPADDIPERKNEPHVTTEPHDGIIVRIEAEYQHGAARLEFMFALVDGEWKSSGFGMMFRPTS